MSAVVVVFILTASDFFRTASVLPVVRTTRVDSSGGIRSRYESRKADDPTKYISPHINSLVQILEEIGILESINSSSTCFVLDNITKEWHPPVDGVSAVQVSLQLRQFRAPFDGKRVLSIDIHEGLRARQKSSGGGGIDNNVMDSGITCLALLTSTTTSTVTPAVTLTQGFHNAVEHENGSMVGLPGGKNKTIVSTETDKLKSKVKEESEQVGLNKRQILVISTCSTVIGAFFVTAFILRIRNYMKRGKQDKDVTRKHMRSASVPHQRTHHGSLDPFTTNDNNRRWSQFNPFNTDR